jgi:hypothetical protein
VPTAAPTITWSQTSRHCALRHAPHHEAARQPAAPACAAITPRRADPFAHAAHRNRPRQPVPADRLACQPTSLRDPRWPASLTTADFARTPLHHFYRLDPSAPTDGQGDPPSCRVMEHPACEHDPPVRQRVRWPTSANGPGCVAVPSVASCTSLAGRPRRRSRVRALLPLSRQASFSRSARSRAPGPIAPQGSLWLSDGRNAASCALSATSVKVARLGCRRRLNTGPPTPVERLTHPVSSSGFLSLARWCRPRPVGSG